MLLGRKIKKSIIISIIKIISFIIVLYLLTFYIFGFYIVKSNNMNPSIKSGTLLIYYRLNKKYDRLDVIVAKNNIYRIIGKYKDKIEIQNNIVLVNGIKEEGDVFFSTYKNDTSKIKYPYEIRKDEYFVLNDYRVDNDDSRSFGTIKEKDIKGKVIGSIQIRGFWF